MKSRGKSLPHSNQSRSPEPLAHTRSYDEGHVSDTVISRPRIPHSVPGCSRKLRNPELICPCSWLPGFLLKQFFGASSLLEDYHQQLASKRVTNRHNDRNRRNPEQHGGDSVGCHVF